MNLRKKIILFLVLTSISILFTGCKKEETDSLKRVEQAGTLTVVGSGGYPHLTIWKMVKLSDLTLIQGKK